ncbi:MAG: MATE family efflux transporter [Myxococcota bacterium]
MDTSSAAVAKLAAPAIAQQLLHTCVFLVDRGMLGHYSADSLASMQISGPIVWSTFSVLSAFSVGSIALVGRLIGGEDRAGASAALRASLALALGLGLVATALGLGLLGPILGAFPEAGPNALEEASAYLVVSFVAMPLMLIATTAAVCLQAAGDTRTPFVVAGLGNALNVGVNYVLIFGSGDIPAMGAKGAAIGSAAAMGWQALALFIILGRRRGALSWRGRGGEALALRRMLRVATASLGERLVQHTGFLGFVAMIGALGTMAMAANQALISIESIVFMSGEGFGIAAATIAAQRLGAGKPADAARGVRAAVAMTIVMLAFYGLVFLVIPEVLLSAFSNDANIIALGVPCMYIAAASAPFMGVGIVLSEALRGAGATREALVVTFVGGLVVRLGATWGFAFALDMGLLGVWLGSTADWIIRAALLTVVFRRGRWQQVSV